MKMIRDDIVNHQSPFTTLGSGRTSLKYKFQRIAWSLRLEFESHADLATCFANTVVVLKDAGTERSLPRVAPVPAAEVLPHFTNNIVTEPELPRDFMEEEWPDETDAELLHFGNSMGINGPLHMIHTATQDLSRAMEHYEST
eukprot:15477928-Alexandrium_andersonii.AAC.1